MSAEVTVLLLRLLLIGGLYLFLFLVILVVTRDIRRGGSVEAGKPASLGQLVVVAVDPSLELTTREFALAPETIIGRDASATIHLPDSFISTRHARLSLRRGRWWLEDLGSTNGTGLSGNAVTRPTAVRDDDVIEVGRVRLQIRRN